MPDRDAMIEAAAKTLTAGGPSASRPVGDVLHDYDWTPIEAARAVLDVVRPLILAEAAGALRAEAEQFAHARYNGFREAAEFVERLADGNTTTETSPNPSPNPSGSAGNPNA